MDKDLLVKAERNPKGHAFLCRGPNATLNIELQPNDAIYARIGLRCQKPLGHTGNHRVTLEWKP